MREHEAGDEQPLTGIPAGEGAGTVLLVEDDLLILTGLEAMLQDWGYTPLTASSVEDALRVLKLGKVPEAIVTDYRLQAGTTGVDAVRAVQGWLGRAIPAAIVTGDTAPERLAEATRGGFHLLHKPVGPSELRQVVAGMVRESRAAG
jgi:CheY-like chemotaxis protein